MQSEMLFWPFKVVARHEDKPMIVMTYKGKEKHFVVEEISSIILAKMKENAETYLGPTMQKVVMTVPAYYSNSQRRAIRHVGVLSGLNVTDILDEPIAAALAYGLDRKTESVGENDLIIFHLSGGTALMGKELFKSINPDEAVACGATV
ncbi:hypothetical protein RJ639_014481 [Escallonia herrerae]|uniref:Uncharacterized protein n=1 Tax=Escallonia herrerae TaxID=1293975 RepID=A0AA88VHR1_9ASTE|nr:hypothetical protein RJ639_014481 [Escallonia herrerae]